MSPESPAPGRSPLYAGPALPRSFYERPTGEVARDLLGRGFWRRSEDGSVTGGILIEVEAYFGPDDPASHAFRRTPRSEIMYGSPGILYVYFTYGMHWCANVVCEEEGRAGAVLLRAIEPLEGVELMAVRRGAAARKRDGEVNVAALCSGPARLTQALAIDGSLNGAGVTGPEVWITAGVGRMPDRRVAVTPRVGVRRATDRAARYVVRERER